MKCEKFEKTNTTKTNGANRRKFGLPVQTDLYLEDGTVYHVRSFFTEGALMGDVMDALEMEKIKRAT